MIVTHTARIENEGKTYDVDFGYRVNSQQNVDRGADTVLPQVRTFRVRKDGSRGLELSGFWSRKSEVLATLDGGELYNAVVAKSKQITYTCGRGFRASLNRELLALVKGTLA